MKISDADRIIVTTFGPGGAPTKSDEWVVEFGDDHIGFWTPDITGWVDRLAQSGVVSVQAADGRGKALREEPVFEGRAEAVTEGDDYEAAYERTKAKYGFGSTVATAVDWVKELGGNKTPNGAVVIHIVG